MKMDHVASDTFGLPKITVSVQDCAEEKATRFYNRHFQKGVKIGRKYRSSEALRKISDQISNSRDAGR
jgi:hypothetical protein